MDERTPHGMPPLFSTGHQAGRAHRRMLRGKDLFVISCDCRRNAAVVALHAPTQVVAVALASRKQDRASAILNGHCSTIIAKFHGFRVIVSFAATWRLVRMSSPLLYGYGNCCCSPEKLR